MRRLTATGVIRVHDRLIVEIGGMDGVRDMNLLDSTISSTFQTFGGIALYPTLEEQAAHLAFSLINNHPFLDGNKRTGIIVMMNFLKANDIELTCTNEEVVSLGLGIADGSFEQEYVRTWIQSHTRLFPNASSLGG